MINYKKGEYVVLLKSCNGKNCWTSHMPENYVYQLSKDSTIEDYSFIADINGNENGWGWWEWFGRKGVDNKTEFRYATNREIYEYDKYNKPCPVITYDIDKEDINKEDYSCLIELLNKIELKIKLNAK